MKLDFNIQPIVRPATQVALGIFLIFSTVAQADTKFYTGKLAGDPNGKCTLSMTVNLVIPADRTQGGTVTNFQKQVTVSLMPFNKDAAPAQVTLNNVSNVGTCADFDEVNNTCKPGIYVSKEDDLQFGQPLVIIRTHNDVPISYLWPQDQNFANAKVRSNCIDLQLTEPTP